MYDVVAHVKDDLTPIRKADIVLAFCDEGMFTVKSRWSHVDVVPSKPILVIAFYRFPEPHVSTIAMQNK